MKKQQRADKYKEEEEHNVKDNNTGIRRLIRKRHRYDKQKRR